MRLQLWDRVYCTIRTKRFFSNIDICFLSVSLEYLDFLFSFWKSQMYPFSSLGVCLFVCCVSLLYSTQAAEWLQNALRPISAHGPSHFSCLLVIQSQYFCWHLWEDGAEEDLKGSVEDRPEQPGEDHRAASEQWQLGEHINQHNWVAIKSPAFTYSWDDSGDSKGDGKHTHSRTHL